MRASSFFAGTTIASGGADGVDGARLRAGRLAAAQALRAEIDQLKKDFDARLADLESRLAALGGAPPPGVVAEPVTQTNASTPTTPPPTAPVPSGAEGGGALPVYGNVSAGSKVFNPDMAVIGDFLGRPGRTR